MRTEKEVRDLLAKPEVHDLWIERYRTPENERFFDLAFDVIAAEFRANGDSVVLDAGCGTAHHTLRLVRRGFRVEAIDFSDIAIREAQERIDAAGFADRIVLKKGDVTQLSYPDEAFSSILCWGVLMHVPEARKAIAELCRVLKRVERSSWERTMAFRYNRARGGVFKSCGAERRSRLPFVSPKASRSGSNTTPAYCSPANSTTGG